MRGRASWPLGVTLPFSLSRKWSAYTKVDFIQVSTWIGRNKVDMVFELKVLVHVLITELGTLLYKVDMFKKQNNVGWETE